MNGQRGQILLITLLALSVATTIALAVVGRATTDVNVSNQLDEAAKAFNAAEAGLEQSLKTGLSTNGQQTISTGVHYQVTKTDIGGGNGDYVLPGKTTKGNTATIWLAAHDDTTGNLIDTAAYYDAKEVTLCWQSTAAVVVAILYKQPTGVYQVVRKAYDPDGARSGSNQFDNSVTQSGCGDGKTNVSKMIDLTLLGVTSSDILLSLRVRSVYSDSQLVVRPQSGSQLPKQGNNYESLGSTDTGLARKVFVNQLYRSPDTVFDYGVYSQQGSFGHASVLLD